MKRLIKTMVVLISTFVAFGFFVFFSKKCPNDDGYVFKNNTYSHLLFIINNLDSFKAKFPFRFNLNNSSLIYGGGINININGRPITLNGYFNNMPEKLRFCRNYWYFSKRYWSNERDYFEPFDSEQEFLSYFHSYFRELDNLGVLSIHYEPTFFEIYTRIHDSTLIELKRNNTDYLDVNYHRYEKKFYNHRCYTNTALDYNYVILCTRNNEVLEAKKPQATMYQVNDSCYLYRSLRYSNYEKIGKMK